jgi:imidazolonepropionase-like amidohydrolase
VNTEPVTPAKSEAGSIGQVIYPFTAYGNEQPPKAEKTLFRNATVWTNEQEGILDETDVLIDGGKIAAIGRDLNANGARVIDATGMHLTSGIIDEHSHIAISGGVNEGTVASSAEVRIGDVINSEDVNIYRQLAGGVTAAQLLHGSANPIGGQSALIKLRWGSMPEEMKIQGADGFIKFALGENVVRANSSTSTKRFPQSRMGVEQVFIDYFTRAREYMAQGDDKRLDLGMEAIVEILQKQRFITCHSYVQSEINMLMKVAERFGIKVNTFTHILEGYKVADKMAEHGAGASTFSDWWAYKFEVIDAIPHNAALLNEMGVVTAINSDDAEMGRRLNQEAAKAVKYGGTSEEDAWKMVTLNPAKLLHLDDRMGSIKPGKDADLVLWTENPLSIYARVRQTYVDGIRYFDQAEDIEIRNALYTERARLTQKMLQAKKGGAKVTKPQPTEEHYYHCDDLEDWAGSDQQDQH